MLDFPQVPELPLGNWVNVIVQWVLAHFRGFFRAISNNIEIMVEGFQSILAGPELIVFGVFILIAVLAAGWRLGVFAALGFGLLEAIDLWPETMDTLALVLTAGVVCVVLGVPLGIAMAKSKTLKTILRPTLDLMQTMPAFVYLIPAITFFSIGPVSGIFATVVFALPPVVRLVAHGIEQVDREVVEASEAFGGTAWQTLIRVQLPLARPSILVGINQTLMLSLSMVVIAAMIGAGGLGGIVLTSLETVDIGLGFEGGMGIVILAVYLDRVTQAMGAARTPGTSMFAGMKENFSRVRTAVLGSWIAGK